jgi:hypothetical protein
MRAAGRQIPLSDIPKDQIECGEVRRPGKRTLRLLPSHMTRASAALTGRQIRKTLFVTGIYGRKLTTRCNLMHS